MDVIDAGKGRVVKSWASLLDAATLEQAKRTARAEVVEGHVALMPDAHLGAGATVGSVIQTRHAIIPAAVGVDIGCGMIAVRTSIERAAITPDMAKRILGQWRASIPAGVGEAHERTVQEWAAFEHQHGLPPSGRATATMAAQFGTLGAGNHFAEVSADEAGRVWLVVHSGSRGVGNQLAQWYIKTAKLYCKEQGAELEDPDLAFLTEGTSAFDAYILDMLWAQTYAFYQRETMMRRMLESLKEAGLHVVEEQHINCHHNYSEQHGSIWLTRKGAINASVAVQGVIPGSMGAASYIVEGLGNEDAYRSAPHGAGRLLARGAAKRTLSVDEFKAAMGDRLWDDYNAAALLDEAPAAYKPIDAVMADARDLVRSRHTLRQFINYKGL